MWRSEKRSRSVSFLSDRWYRVEFIIQRKISPQKKRDFSAWRLWLNVLPELSKKIKKLDLKEDAMSVALVVDAFVSKMDKKLPWSGDAI